MGFCPSPFWQDEKIYAAGEMEIGMKNGTKLLDTNGNILHAHGGWMLKKDGWFYWFGENRLGDIRVSCYRSKDMENWEHRNDVLTLSSQTKEHYIRVDGRMKHEFPGENGAEPYILGCNIERPKVIYNKKNDNYVMWMHYENGKHYGDARCAVAVCDTIDGDYRYMGSFNPVGNMARDCTVFVEDDGTAYFMAAARENQDLILYRLTDDYLAIEEQVKILWPGQCREAPALFKREGLYYLLTSACTGWAPNQGKYAVSGKLTEGWSNLMNFGDETTYRSQAAFVLPLQGPDGIEYVYVGDRWNGEAYHESTYTFYPLHFDNQGRLELEYAEEITFNLPEGKVRVNGGEQEEHNHI